MGDDEELTPLGHLLEEARGSMSKRQAAKLAGISEGRWRQVVTGKQHVRAGVTVPANPKRETVIAMARAVGVDVDEALRCTGMRPLDKDNVVPLTRDESTLAIPYVSSPASVAWDRVSDVDLARFGQAVAEEVVRRALHRAAIDGAQAAAYRSDTPSAYEEQTGAQDVTGEAPDAPGPEHGA